MKKGYEVFLLAFLLLINLVQALFTDIILDEGYYWGYSKDLTIGYFEHPPGVAVLIFISDLLFDNELGVRFMTCLVWFVSILLFWDLAKRNSTPKDFILFLLILLSLPGINIYSFITTPDVPLLLTSSLFIYCYYIWYGAKEFWKYAVLGILMAAMLYSKYHGILVIGFVFLSDPKLLKHFWKYLGAGLIGILFFLPHLLWQYENDFPSATYHLFERSSGFMVKNVYEFILNQIVFFNPILVIGTGVFYIIKKPVFGGISLLDRTFIWLIAGCQVFFFFMSLKGHVEPHWTLFAQFPFGLLLYKMAMNDPNWKKALYKMTIVSIIIMGAIRFFMIFDVLPFDSEFHGQKKWHSPIVEASNGKPVLMEGVYQAASRFELYTGMESYGLSNIYGKNSFYDFKNNWQEKLYGKEVYRLKKMKWSDEGQTGKNRKATADGVFEVFEEPRGLQIINPKKKLQLSNSKSEQSITLEVLNKFDIEQKINSQTSFGLLLIQDRVWADLLDIKINKEYIIQPKETMSINATIIMEKGLLGTYDGVWTCGQKDNPPFRVSTRPIQVQIEE